MPLMTTQQWCAMHVYEAPFMHRAGSIKLRGLAWSPVSVRETEVVQPPSIGGHSVLKSDRVVLDSSLASVLTGMYALLYTCMLSLACHVPVTCCCACYSPPL